MSAMFQNQVIPWWNDVGQSGWAMRRPAHVTRSPNLILEVILVGAIP